MDRLVRSQARIAAIFQRIVGVLNILFASVSALLLAVSLLADRSFSLTRTARVVYLSETVVNAIFILGLVYFGQRLLRGRQESVKPCIWFFTGELVYFVLVVGSLFAGGHRPMDDNHLFALHLGSLPFLPQVVTAYPLTAGSALLCSYIVSRTALRLSSVSHKS